VNIDDKKHTRQIAALVRAVCFREAHGK